jgi:hypothetical protein
VENTMHEDDDIFLQNNSFLYFHTKLYIGNCELEPVYDCLIIGRNDDFFPRQVKKLLDRCGNRTCNVVLNIRKIKEIKTPDYVFKAWGGWQ